MNSIATLENVRPAAAATVRVRPFAVADEPRWDSIVIDPIGEMYGRLLTEQSERSRHPSLEQRGNAWADLERWIRSLVEAPVHVIIVAHEMQAQQGDELKSFAFVGSQTASTQGFGPKLMGLVDFIAFTGVLLLANPNRAGLQNWLVWTLFAAAITIVAAGTSAGTSPGAKRCEIERRDHAPWLAFRAREYA